MSGHRRILFERSRFPWSLGKGISYETPDSEAKEGSYYYGRQTNPEHKD